MPSQRIGESTEKYAIRCAAYIKFRRDRARVDPASPPAALPNQPRIKRRSTPRPPVHRASPPPPDLIAIADRGILKAAAFIDASDGPHEMSKAANSFILLVQLRNNLAGADRASADARVASILEGLESPATSIREAG